MAGISGLYWKQGKGIKMKRREAITFISIAVFIFCGVSVLFAQEVSETKSLSFTKNVVVKKYKQGEVHAEPYRVQEEDTLWKILIDGYGVKDNQFYFFCRITKSLNPDLKDADQLVPDQMLLIPFKYITHFNIPQDQMRISFADCSFRTTLSSSNRELYLLRRRTPGPGSPGYV